MWKGGPLPEVFHRFSMGFPDKPIGFLTSAIAGALEGLTSGHVSRLLAKLQKEPTLPAAQTSKAAADQWQTNGSFGFFWYKSSFLLFVSSFLFAALLFCSLGILTSFFGDFG